MPPRLKNLGFANMVVGPLVALVNVYNKAVVTGRVPRRLIGQESRDGKIPARVYPVFRDWETAPW